MIDFRLSRVSGFIANPSYAHVKVVWVYRFVRAVGVTGRAHSFLRVLGSGVSGRGTGFRVWASGLKACCMSIKDFG